MIMLIPTVYGARKFSENVERKNNNGYAEATFFFFYFFAKSANGIQARRLVAQITLRVLLCHCRVARSRCYFQHARVIASPGF